VVNFLQVSLHTQVAVSSLWRTWMLPVNVISLVWRSLLC